VTDPATDPPVESAWMKLRRRKVVQWGVAYAAGAWGFLQGVQFLAEAFEWSSRVLKLSTLAFVLGLPVVLVLAWYHGDRGEQRVTRVELAIVTLLFLIGGGLFWRYHSVSEPQREARTSSASSEPAETIADSRPSIAVLPFDNRSAKQDDTYFVDGIHDDILTQLSKVSGMRVISRTSVEQFRDTKLPIKNTAEQLGVAQILEGGVQRAGDRVRVTVQLIDAATDGHVWAENYDRELTAANIFAIQSEVATAIAAALKATLTADEKTRLSAIPTQNLEAWEAYQLGKQRMAKRTSDGLTEAEEFFRKAIDIDPAFALAYSGLADALSLQVEYSGESSEAPLAEADRAASRALEFDPNLGEAWASRGNVALTRAQWEDAERFLRRAIELNPNYAPAHQWMSFVLRGENRLEEERAHAERAVQLDPLSAVVSSNLGYTLEAMGRFDEAAARYRRAIENDGTSTGGFASLAWLYAYAQDRFAEAVPLLERAVALDGGNPGLQADLATVLVDLGDTSRADQLVAAILARWPDDEYANAVAIGRAAARGDDAAVERLAGKILAVQPRNSVGLKQLRNLDLQRGDPRAARARYASAFPEFFGDTVPRIGMERFQVAIDLALVLQGMGELDRAAAVLDASERFMHSLSRLGGLGYEVADVQIHALRGDKVKALAALREAEKAGWRGPAWRYYRDSDPALASIRDEPEFKAVFADIERDMVRQRAELAARPKDAPLELGSH
jgi:TolB-like protein/Flp pilus assembly protein TadD